MTAPLFKGVITALITPLHDGNVDEAAFATLIERQIAAGVSGLVPVGTSQGGTVYYFTTHDQRHQLLPQRLSRFADFLALVQSHSGVDTSRIGRLTPPWTYQLLAALAVTMIIGEAALAFAIQQGWIISPVGGPG